MDRIVAVAGVPAPLGPALVRSFALAGDDVVAAVPSGGPARRAAGLAADLRAEGARVVAVPAGSVADGAVAPFGPDGTATAGSPAGIATAYGAVRDAFGRVDVLVAGWRCRGGAPAADGEAASGVESHRSTPTRGATPGDAGGRLPRPDAVERAWRASAEAGYRWAREAAPDLRATGGTLLFVGPVPGAPATDGAASRRSRLPDPATAGAAAATWGLARALAARLGPDGVRVAHVGLATGGDYFGEANGGAGGRDVGTGDAGAGDSVGVPAANGVCGDPAATAAAVRRVLRRADWSPAVAVVPGEDGPAVVDAGERPRCGEAGSDGGGTPDRETPF